MIASVLLRPTSVSPTQFSWLPLIAGLSLANAVSSFGGTKRASVKWPNDVLIADRKIAGVLSEALSDFSGVVVGTGLNVFQTREQLPVETASSLNLEGISVPSIDALLAEYLKNLKKNYEEFIACGGELAGTELLNAIKNACGTIGRRVRAIMPGDKELLGDATDIDDLGRLVIAHDSKHTPVSVGDIVHLRHN
jgi:BirA family biotin operon repressor/biotin-[acetyl-CoA-carboxylase] ligase